ncbi:hypothetical protein ACHWQZ_G012715 [Mnemiopsis leidyi]
MIKSDEKALLSDGSTGDEVDLYGTTQVSDQTFFSESDYSDLSKIYLTWENLSVLHADQGDSSKCRKGNNYEYEQMPGTVSILSDVSGVAKPGELMAIIGASGSGKTTLLNALACRNPGELDVSGTIKINGHKISREILRDLSGYVEQNDTFLGSMTASEVLFFYVSLMLDRGITREEKEAKAIKVLRKVGLYKVKDCLVGDRDNPGLSGGEKRRLAVATQLLCGASLIFLDEVTTGLDSFNAESVIEMIKNLAISGCTILCIIHQPSSKIYETFDKVCLMSEGNIAFLGDKTDALTYFKNVGQPCPPNNCPADHFISTLAIQPGDEQNCRETCSLIVESYKASSFYQSVVDDIESVTMVIKENMASSQSVNFNLRKRSTFWTQFIENVRRSLREVRRNPNYTRSRITTAIIVSAFLGLILLHADNNIKTVGTNKGGWFFVFVFVQLSRATSFSAVAIALDLPVVKREYKNGLYSTVPYFMSVVISEMLYSVLSTLIELAIVYFMVGLKKAASAFFTAFLCVTMLRFSGCGIGWFAGALVEEPRTAALIGIVIDLPFIVLSGVVASDETVSWYLIPIKYLSNVRYAYRTLMVNEFKDLQLDCGNKSCSYNGTKILFDKGISLDELWWPNTACNLGIGIVFVALTALLLVSKTRRY